MKNVNQQDDFRIETPESEVTKENLNDMKKDTSTSLEKVEIKTTNILFSTMIFFTAIGTCLMIVKLDEFLQPLKQINNEYKFPSISDFKITLATMPFIIVSINFFSHYNYSFQSFGF